MRFDLKTGAVTTPELATAVSNPAIFVLSRQGAHLYLCPSSGISAYTVDAVRGTLTLLNHRAAEERGPSHISLDHTGRFVLDALHHVVDSRCRRCRWSHAFVPTRFSRRCRG